MPAIDDGGAHLSKQQQMASLGFRSEPLRADVTKDYNGEEQNVQGGDEGGYLPLQTRQRVHIVTGPLPIPGHEGNRFEYYFYCTDLVNDHQEGWVPSDVL